MKGQIQAISRHMEGQESSGLNTHEGKLKKYCMFLGMILETSKVQKWSMGSKESVEG